jgi:hypothetical protein
MNLVRSVFALAASAAATLLAVGACTDDSSSTSRPDGGTGTSPGLDATPGADTGTTPGPNDAGGNPDADASDGAPSCALPGAYGSVGCENCLKRNCCAQITTCEGEGTCKPLQACLLACTGPDAGGCYDGCMAGHPLGVATWNTVEGCWFGDPPTGCGPDCL